jgi:hypothetical protein
MFFLVRKQLGHLKDEVMQSQVAQASIRTQSLLEDVADHRRYKHHKWCKPCRPYKIHNLVSSRVLITDLANLSRTNGMDEWRHQEHKALTELVQARIKHLQVRYYQHALLASFNTHFIPEPQGLL